MRSKKTNESLLEMSDKLWSPYVTKVERTLADKPEMPPKMTMGSFEVVSHDIQKRTIYVYWRQIPDYNRNGPNFRYTVTEVIEAGKLRRPIVPKVVTKAYAMFTDLRLANYTF